MIINLILMYFDNQKGPKAYDMTPRPVSEEQEEVLGRLFDVHDGEGFFVHNTKLGKEKFICANYLFFVDSKWARGGKEMAMLSLIVEPDIKPEIFETTLASFSKAISSMKDVYKGFYMNSDKGDAAIEKSFKLIKRLNTDCYEACRRKPEAQKPGRMLIIGLRAVGKSSLIDRVTQDKFNPRIKPTLGMQIIKSVVDNFKFNIYDLGGQEKIRKGWYKKRLKPNAIIFVIDVTADKDQHEDAKEEFDRMIATFFNEKSPKKVEDDTPVLILGNKIDLNGKFTEKKIKSLLKPPKELNYKIGLCSAMTGEGIEDNFKWLVKSFLFV